MFRDQVYAMWPLLAVIWLLATTTRATKCGQAIVAPTVKRMLGDVIIPVKIEICKDVGIALRAGECRKTSPGWQKLGSKELDIGLLTWPA